MKKHSNTSNNDIIDRSRMKIIFLACITLLLSSFEGKTNECDVTTSNYGKLKLIDGTMLSYVFNSGLVACKASRCRKMIHALKALVLGTIKLYFHIKNKETTSYINIFYLLCLVNILSMIWVPKRAFIYGIFILLFYQIMLVFILQSYINNDIHANTAFQWTKLIPVVYIVPLYSLYLMSYEVGKSIVELKHRKTIRNLIFISFIFYSLYRCFFNVESDVYNARFCMLVFLVNIIDLYLFDFCNSYFTLTKLEITKFASRIVFHLFITTNLFIPLARKIGFFSDCVVYEKCLKITFYLFIIFYGFFRIKQCLIKKSRLSDKWKAWLL